jgi:hypothetical protein
VLPLSTTVLVKSTEIETCEAGPLEELATLLQVSVRANVCICGTSRSNLQGELGMPCDKKHGAGLRGIAEGYTTSDAKIGNR